MTIDTLPESLAELADRSLARWGDRPSLWFEGRWFTSGELADRARRWAGALTGDLDVHPGDRVVVMLPSTPEVGISYQAVWRAGAVVTPVVFLMAGKELNHVLTDSGAIVVITSPEFLATVLAAVDGSAVRTVVVVGGEAAETGASSPQLIPSSQLDEHEAWQGLVPRAGSDLSALLYTGGTTGRAKGVMLTHTGLSAAGIAGADSSYVPGLNRTLLPLPLSHAYGLLITCIGLAVKEPGDAILMRWFDPVGFLRLVQEHRPHRAAVVPSMLAMLLAQPLEDYDLSSLRYISSGGAPLAPELQAAFEARVPNVTVLEGYGMTETSALCTTNPPSEARKGTVGRAVPGMEVRVVDPLTDQVQPAGSEGEVQVRGRGVMAGYWHDEDATATTMRGGWLHTGDIGVLDDDGYLRIVDRLKDLIIRGGFNVYPRDVEDVLVSHPDVTMAGVVGKADPVYGEEVVAFVSVVPGSTATGPGLVAWARTRLAAQKYPREVTIVDTVPLTSVGKLDRKALRALL